MYSGGQILEITDQGASGEGIARTDGKVVFVEGALKGEVVSAQIFLEKNDFCRAKTIKIIKGADFRVNPVCPSFCLCGGCDLMHMDYSSQLRLKRQNVKSCLDKALKADTFVSKVIPSKSSLFYRNKIRVSIGFNADKEIEMGFFSERTHSVIPFEKCFLQNKIQLSALFALRKFANKNKDIIYDKSTGRGALRQVVIQDFAGTVILSLNAVCPPYTRLRPLNGILKAEYGENYSLYAAELLKKGMQKDGGSLKAFLEECFIEQKNLLHISGKKEISENVLGVKTTFNPLAFRQINDGIRDLLYADVVGASGGEVVIDAYSGCGLMSMLLAKKAKKVFAVEIDQNACDAARKSKAENVIDNVEIICGDCKTELLRIVKVLTKSQKENLTVVLDPPRKGCEGEILKCVKQANPLNIIYISCNPATLARDLAALMNDEKAKREIVRIQPYDMFAQTAHVETLVHLKRID